MQQQIQNIARKYFLTEFGRSDGFTVTMDKHRVSVLLYFYPGEHAGVLQGLIKDAVPAEYTVDVITEIIPHKVTNIVRGLPRVKNIIAIASGKGGVGKSTLASSLAIAMAKLGAKTGLVDADIHGPSQPKIMGCNLEMGKMKSLDPIELFGVQTASISYFMTKDSPVVWRGPMVSRALEQMIYDINWQELDYLFVDMPPGTGDIALTLAKKIPVVGSVIVTTPQDVALLDAKKAAEMFTKTNVPVLGVVENMSYHICENCNHKSYIFGHKGGMDFAQNSDYSFLGSIPLDKNIQIGCDEGKPAVMEKNTAKFYLDIAIKLGYHLSLMPKDHVRGFPAGKAT